MGVTYKLKQDVINFIIDQKRNNPKLGCRELAELASDKFKIKISKSSANSIIKNMDLSNSVGRPSKKIEEKNKKFQIPSEKKQQISKELHKIPIPTENVVLSNQKSIDTGVNSGLRNNSVMNKNVLGKLDISDRKINDKKMPSKKKFDVIDSVQDMNDLYKSLDIKYAGLIFLKLAFWENLEDGFLGGLTQTFNTGYEKSLYDKLCNALFLYAALDINQENDDLNLLLSVTDQIENININPQTIDKTIPLSDQVSLMSRTELELEQLSNQVGGFLIKLTNKTIIRLNASLTEIIDSEKFAKYQLPFKCSLDKLSNFVITNKKPLILFDSSVDGVFSNTLFDLLGSLGGLDGYKIEEISILGAEGNVLADFSFIPQFSRKFAFGVFENNVNFSKIVKTSQWAPKESITVSSCGETILYTTTKTDYFNKKIDGFKKDLTVLTVWKEGDPSPIFAIITNLEKCYKYIISRYLWCFDVVKKRVFVHNLVSVNQGQKNNSIGEVRKLKDLFLKIYGFLTIYMLNNYFEEKESYDVDNNILMNIYRIDGTVDFQENELIFTLNIPQNAPFFNLINDAIKVVNKRDIVDPLGRCIKLRI